MPMPITAKLQYLRMAPRKVRRVADLIRGAHVDEAAVQLRHLLKRAAHPLLKLLNSAIANAQHNFRTGRGNLFVSQVRVDGGPMLKRFRPRAFGRAATIRRRTSHVLLVLEERTSGARRRSFRVEPGVSVPAGEGDSLAAPAAGLERRREERERAAPSGALDARRERGRTRWSGIGRRIFRRKSV